MSKLPPIIGIHGKINVGKDTVADYLVSEYKYMKAGFSDPLKYVCAELFLDSPKKFFSEEGKKEVMPYWGITRRAALQFVGTELVREHLFKLTHPEYVETFGSSVISDHWIRCMQKRREEQKIELLVINDLRFQNEADWVYANSGWVIHVVKQQLDNEDGITGHSSEEPIRFNGDRTRRIENNGTFKELYTEVEKFVLEYQNNSIV